jgi:hypothetical protein
MVPADVRVRASRFGFSAGGLAIRVDDADVKHLLWLQRELEENVVDTVVLSTGPRAYRRPDGVAVIPLALLGP